MNSLLSNTTGCDNSAFGINSLRLNTTGYYNSAFGRDSLYENTTGYNNSAFGTYSLRLNTEGYNNSAFGLNSLLSNTTGYYNSAFGTNSLQSNTTGYNNSAFGTNSLFLNTTGDYNSAFGRNSLAGLETHTNCSGIGYDSQVSGSNQVQLGNSATTTYAFGAVQNRSDLRDKADIRPTSLGLSFIKSLRPVDFRWDLRDSYRKPIPQALKMDASEQEKALYDAEMKKWLEENKLSNIAHDGSKKGRRYHHGVIAQEVQELIRTTGVDFGGFQDHKVAGGDDVLSVGYPEFIAPLIKAVQELSDMNDALKERVKALEAKAA
jgi:hypothetical protein